MQLSPPVSRLRQIAAFAVAALVLTSLASAQHVPSAGEIALARQEFMAGVDAARTDVWESALSHFERSFALYPRPETQFNIAGALRRLGRVVAATEAYRKYLVGPADSDEHTRPEQARAALRELEPLLPMVTLRVAGIAPGDRVLLDGVQINEAVLSVKLPVEPGSHVFVVERAEQEVARREFSADPQTHIVVTAEVAAPQTPPRTPVVASPQEAARTQVRYEPGPDPVAPDDRNVRQRRLWIGASVGLVVAGAVSTALWLSLREQPEETDGNFGPGQVEVR